MFYAVGQKGKLVEIEDKEEALKELVGGELETFKLPDIPAFEGNIFYVVMDIDAIGKDKKVNRGDLRGDIAVMVQNGEQYMNIRSMTKEEAGTVNYAVELLLPPAEAK